MRNSGQEEDLLGNIESEESALTRVLAGESVCWGVESDFCCVGCFWHVVVVAVSCCVEFFVFLLVVLVSLLLFLIG